MSAGNFKRRQTATPGKRKKPRFRKGQNKANRQKKRR
jgi:hypothetical protein